VLVVLLALMIAGGGCRKEEQAKTPPAPVVEVVKVQQKDVPVYREWVGALDGSINAVIRPQVTGYLVRQNYLEGQVVKKGQILFEIDPRTFQAAVNQTQASLEQAQGTLAIQEANAATASADLARVRPLAEKNAVSKKDLDDAIGRDLAARASVEAALAGVAVAAANLEKARLDLGFTRIVSPVDGIAGIAKTQLGNLVSPTMQDELTSVSTLDPIKVYINVSEREYLEARESRKHLSETSLQLILADGSVYPFPGDVALSDRQVDPTTGTFKIGALFPNKDNLLRPGQYGRVRVLMTTKKGALLVPQRAVGLLQGKHLMAVVDAKNTIDVRLVQVAEQIGSDWVIEKGLQPGETVVVEGLQKVRPGMAVTPKPFSPAAHQPASLLPPKKG
jgi:membrane fusion protein (multidrug efflux system)